MYGWLRLASHLHLPLQLVMQTTTSTEFIMWMEYLNLEESRNKKYEHYLAQIACEIRRNWAKNPGSIKYQDFLFKPAKDIPKVKSDINTSKNFWFTATGYLNKRKK